MSGKIEEIVKFLSEKSTLKQEIYRNTLDIFGQIRKMGNEICKEVNLSLDKNYPEHHPNVKMEFRESSEFEYILKFSGDALIFNMHTNVFSFPDEHSIFKNPYVKQDRGRAYCGQILIYNFLNDSLKYGRLNDLGHLIARLFVNAENHFFLEGIRQFSFLYPDISENLLTEVNLKEIILQTIIYAIEIDLISEPFMSLKDLTVYDKLSAVGINAGRKLGFDIQNVKR